MTTDKNRNGTIDLVKFFGAMIVFSLHVAEVGWSNYDCGTTIAIIVELFFIISGFFLMSHLDHLSEDSKENTGIYVINKIKGFFAPLCIANLVHFILFCRMNGFNTIQSVASEFWHFKWEFLLLQCAGMIQNPQFNQDYLLGPAWYLSAMMISLVVLYPLAKHYRKVFVNIICPVSILFIYAGFIYTYGNMNVGNANMLLVSDAVLRAFAGQCCGVLCYYAYQYIKKNQLENTSAYKIIDVVSWLMILLMLVLGFSGIHDSPIFFVIPMGFIVINSILGDTPVSKALSMVPLNITNFLGKMSLYVYLTHFTVLSFVFNYIPSLDSIMKVLLSIALTCVYSLLLYALDKKRHGTKPVCIICGILIVFAFMQTIL